MRSTDNYALPYPESGDHTRTWEYWQGLAQKVDQVLAGGKFGTPVAYAAKPSASPLSNLANTLVPCDNASVNKGGFVISAAGVAVPVKGLYAIRFQALLAFGTEQSSQLWIKTAAGAGLAYGALRILANANSTPAASVPVVQLNAGDVVACYVSYPGTLLATDAPSGAPGTQLSINLLAPVA